MILRVWASLTISVPTMVRFLGQLPLLTSQLPRISVRGRSFVDDVGRVRIFHGMNDIANDGGSGESQGPFNGSNYLPRLLARNESFLAELVNDLGFNCFRIMAGWAALKPAPGATDTAYLGALQNVTRLLSRHGAYSLLDMHQDGLSTRFGMYDGAPRWLINLTQARHPYPWPYRAGGSFNSELTEASGQAYSEIYHDTHGGLTAWSQAWRAFADRFKDEPSVLGYELINEPWPGDVYSDPLLFLPGEAGAKSLQPAYDQVVAAIREVDNTTSAAA